MPSGLANKADRSKYMDVVNHGIAMAKERFDSAWFVDHFQFEERDVLEGWTALTYEAALHPELQFGNAVLCQSFRNPAHLAKMGATLQFMTGGRFILGLGAGWHEEEYKSYNYPFPPAGVRVDQLDEYVQIIKTMWTEQHATFEGKYYAVHDVVCEPMPDPVPTIMIGAMKPRMIDLAVRHADWWNVSWTNIQDYRHMVEICEKACEKEKRDPATLRRTWFGGCACAPTEAALTKLLGGKPFSPDGFSGTPAQVIDQMRAFIDMGVDYFLLGTAGLPDFTTLEMLLNEVIPALDKE
jgi:alkanesulfonate monooxygenase SsuD/methylene tetrahydromethanopterin reductase-like flavin-dependent oxidoreductase (luciferase family)